MFHGGNNNEDLTNGGTQSPSAEQSEHASKQAGVSPNPRGGDTKYGAQVNTEWSCKDGVCVLQWKPTRR